MASVLSAQIDHELYSVWPCTHGFEPGRWHGQSSEVAGERRSLNWMPTSPNQRANLGRTGGGAGDLWGQQHIRSVTDRFAQEGYFSVAPALFDRVEPHVELSRWRRGHAEGNSLAQKINIENAVKDVDAALQYAAKETGKPAGVVGYCYGGTLAWLSATRLAPAAAVGLLRWPHRQVRPREPARSCHAPLRKARPAHSAGRCRESAGGASGGGSRLYNAGTRIQ